MKQHPGGYFIFTVRDKDGNIKSRIRQKNTVTAFAKRLMLTNALTGIWFIGLIRSFEEDDPNLRVPPFDPVVLNSLDWQEYESYTGQRKAWTPVISVDPDPPEATGNEVQFVGFNEAMTFGMAGAFLARTATKGSDYDTVFAFSTGGSIVTLDDILDVNYEIII